MSAPITLAIYSRDDKGAIRVDHVDDGEKMVPFGLLINGDQLVNLTDIVLRVVKIVMDFR